MESLDDLLSQLEKSSDDLKKQHPAKSVASRGPVKATTMSTQQKTYRGLAHEPVEISSTRWTTKSTVNGSTGVADITKPNVVDQARRLPDRRAAAADRPQQDNITNGYSSVVKTAKNSQRGDEEREPVIYAHNPVASTITSYRHQNEPKASGTTGSGEQRQAASSERDSLRSTSASRPSPQQRQSRRQPTTTDAGASPSTATRALDELMSSFGSLQTKTTAVDGAARDRQRREASEDRRTTPRPYNELNETVLDHAGSAASLADLRGKSPTPPLRDSVASNAGQNQSQQQLLENQDKQQVVYYQPIIQTAKGTSVSYDPNYNSSHAERQAEQQSAGSVSTASTRLSRLQTQQQQQERRFAPTGVTADVSGRSSPIMQEHLYMQTIKTTTPDELVQHPAGILKRSPTPSRETVNRRIAGVNTEDATAYGGVGRPRSVALSDDEDQYETVREYQYERRETTTTKETTTDELDSNRASKRKDDRGTSTNNSHTNDRANINSKSPLRTTDRTHNSDVSVPRRKVYSPAEAEARSTTTTTTSVRRLTRNEDSDATLTSVNASASYDDAAVQPASILRNSTATVTGKTCSGCGKPASSASSQSDPLVTALGRLWHMQCFACNQCSTVLNNVPFFERQQKLWCEHDYLQHFSPKCAQCSQAIIGQCVTALGGQQFHPNCFQCSDCKQPLMNTGNAASQQQNAAYAEIEGKAMCNNCYSERFGKKCGGCGTMIRGGTSYVEALGSAWHDECFRCHMCNDSINTAATLHELDGKPVCERDYYGRYGATCATCKQPIVGRCITAMGKKFHPDHFACSYCKRELNRGLFKELEGVPWCHTCWAKVFCNEDQVVITQPATRAMPLAPLAYLNRNSPARF